MRNENLHQVVVVGTDSKRIFVTEVETSPGDNWAAHCAVVFGKWMHDNHGYKLMNTNLANGTLTAWVARSKR